MFLEPLKRALEPSAAYRARVMGFGNRMLMLLTPDFA